ncbi:MYCBP AMY-1-associated, testis expressed 1 [Perkinsus chesapeaki]|uniref:Cilia- and flagella-associated protein 91 n=1 Tax=Perkinsus chesapeaki TaxID=330153 RepID=A0A7J6LS93_PERCH|nr:MYCBP AMY-1-associated, testis expressed 1 [Perkinsus chesapeaki]
MLVLSDPFQSVIGIETTAAQKRATSWYSSQLAVSGKERAKYFNTKAGLCLPIQSAVYGGGATVFTENSAAEFTGFASSRDPFQSSHASSINGPRSRTVAVQSDYRDAESQTDPYSPPLDLTGEEDARQRELLNLEQLTYLNGGLNPSGEEMDEMIEDKRLQMEYENDRDGYNQARDVCQYKRHSVRLERLSKRRVEALSRALSDLRKEHTAKIDATLTRIRKQMQHEQGKELLRLHTDQTRRLRKSHFNKIRDLATIKSLGNPEGHLGSVIDRNVCPSSSLWVAALRDGPTSGCIGDTLAPSLDNVTAVKNLEECPAVMAAVRMPRPAGDMKKQLRVWLGMNKDRLRAVKVMEELQKPNRLPLLEEKGILKDEETKEEEGGEEGNKRKKTKLKGYCRPASPEVIKRHPEDEKKVMARLILTKLIRGRAAQMIMYQGRDRRIDLINELMYMEAHTGVQTATDEIDRTVLISSHVEGAVCKSIIGRTIGRSLGELAKDRLREIGRNRVAKMVAHAEGERRRKEGREAGHRQALLRLKSFQEGFRRSVDTMVQREGDSLVADAMAAGVRECAKRRALGEARATARYVNPVLDKMEEEKEKEELGNDLGQTEILQRLMREFLWPQVERRRVAEGLAVHQRRFAGAAQLVILDTFNSIADDSSPRAARGSGGAQDRHVALSMLAGYDSASSSSSSDSEDDGIEQEHKRNKEAHPLPSASAALADYDSTIESRKKQRTTEKAAAAADASSSRSEPSQHGQDAEAAAGKAVSSSSIPSIRASTLRASLLTGGLSAPANVQIEGFATTGGSTGVWDDPPEAQKKNKKRNEMVEMMRDLEGVSSRELKNIQQLGATAQDIDPSSLQDDHWYEALQANEQARKVQEAALGDFFDTTEGAKQANPGGQVGKNHKRKHHINWLAEDTIDHGAKRLMDLGTQAGKRGQTARKYGW